MMDTHELKQQIKSIFVKLERGELEYKEAQSLAQPFIDQLNETIKAKTKELNKKYGVNRKPALQDFVNLRRSQELL